MGFTTNPRIDELNQELEALDSQRIKALEEVQAKARKVKAERDRLLMVDQLTLRFLNASPLSGPEQDWIEANPDVWADIREKHKGKRGSRKTPVHVTAK